MNKQHAIEFIAKANQFLIEGLVYTTILDCGYSIGGSEDYENGECIRFFEGLDQNNKHFYLCEVSMTLLDEIGGLECTIMMKPEKLQEIFEENEREANRVEMQNLPSYVWSEFQR